MVTERTRVFQLTCAGGVLDRAAVTPDGDWDVPLWGKLTDGLWHEEYGEGNTSLGGLDVLVVTSPLSAW